MCGIISYISVLQNNVLEILFQGLEQLQNRGYDSAGVCFIEDDQFHNIKYASTVNENALDKLQENLSFLENNNLKCGIAHTRWATHGPKTDENAHPHISFHKNFALVHNGIIENYQELRDFLTKEDYIFSSQTDTEVIVNLIEYYYLKANDVENSIELALKQCRGTWGIVVMSFNHPNHLFVSRQGSPLLISYDENQAFITSEQSGFQNKIQNYIVLQNHDIITLSIENNKIFFKNSNKEFNYEKKNITLIDTLNLDKSQFPHWTIKEIYEQPDSIRRALSFGARLSSNNEVKLGGLSEHTNELKEIENIIFLGCGTSYHSALIGMHYFKDICGFNYVTVIDGAEFEVKDIPKIGKTALILISQSGETKDLHRCIEIGRDNDLFLIGIINVVDSLIAREVHCGVYLNAGREVGVASTKAFTSQCVVLALISIWFSQIHNINSLKRKLMIEDLRKLPLQIESFLQSHNIENFVDKFMNKNSTFILGKGKSEAVAREGALKIKEISYIHAEGYSSSSLKHGPFALLEKDFPVLLINPSDKHYSKSNNAKEEIISRHANVFVVNNKEHIQTPINKSFQEILDIIPIQLLAYYISVKKGFNPDMPKNLAKVVTVE